MGLERLGFDVQRIALRGWSDSLPDQDDRREQQRTRYVLQAGTFPLVISVLRVLFSAPLRLLKAGKLAFHMTGASDRPLAYHLVYVAEACRMLPWLKAFGARHLHAHFGTNSAEVAMLVHALGGPTYSFTIHGPDEFISPIGLEEKVRQAEFVVTVSSFGRSQTYLRSRFADWAKVKIVHCGLERSFYEVPAIPVPDVPRLICVGRLCEAKGQMLLIEAAARVQRKHPAFELVLAGDGPMRGQIEDLIRTYRLTAHVRITGWISSDQVRSEILAARALVLPSFAEGLPVVIMEAMALRRPVISTYIAGIPELIQPAHTGWLVPAGSLHALVDAIEECLALPPADLQDLGDAAYLRVTERHSIDTEAGKLSAMFNGVDS